MSQSAEREQESSLSSESKGVTELSSLYAHNVQSAKEATTILSSNNKEKKKCEQILLQLMQKSGMNRVETEDGQVICRGTRLKPPTFANKKFQISCLTEFFDQDDTGNLPSAERAKRLIEFIKEYKDVYATAQEYLYVEEEEQVREDGEKEKVQRGKKRRRKASDKGSAASGDAVNFIFQ